MLVVIKKKVKDNDEASNRLLQMAVGYASASIAITALSPMIFAAFRKKIENYVGGNTTSVTEDTQSLQANERVGARNNQSLNRQDIEVRRVGRRLSSDGATIQENGQNVSSSEDVVTGSTNAVLRQHN